MKCPHCTWEGKPEDYTKHYDSEHGENASTNTDTIPFEKLLQVIMKENEWRLGRMREAATHRPLSESGKRMLIDYGSSVQHGEAILNEFRPLLLKHSGLYGTISGQSQAARDILYSVGL